MIFSGIQPSGRLHLGNYLGAIRQWVTRSRDMPCMYSVVDLHAMTQRHTGEGVRGGTREMASFLLACGLPVDSVKVTLFPQSAVREHTELAWLLSCQTPLGKLQRMTQFKHKSGSAKAQSNLGLLSYPVLQAADILLYRATHVPVGEDQVQHLELAREVAEGANAAWGDPTLFPIPATLIMPSPVARVMSLKDGAVKMSKSDPDDASRINMDDSNDAIAAKVKGAKTDSEPGFYPWVGGVQQPGGGGTRVVRPEKANLVGILAALTGRDMESVAQEYASSSAVAFKGDLTEALVATIAPIRTKLEGYRKDPSEVDAVLKAGSHAARDIAAKTMERVRALAGYS